MGEPGLAGLGSQKIVITGGAGLVGQNLVATLLAAGCENLTVLDKARHNLAVAARLHPRVTCIEADLSQPGPWRDCLAGADVVVMLHAQIGGSAADNFLRNNVVATQHVLASAPRDAYLIHVSSSVIESAANDAYRSTKARQEELVVNSGLRYTVLRPTLMFGWFDRKHLGWLSRFMSVSPVFPIPGHGNYIRQPLYAGDFCAIILACIKNQPPPACHNISGKEKITFIDIIRSIRSARRSRCLLLKLPYRFFYALLAVYAAFDRDPPFTTSQLKALVIDEVFEDTDWEGLFGVQATPFERAVIDTFTHPVFSKIHLRF